MINQGHLDFLRGLDLEKMTQLAEGVLSYKSWPTINRDGEDEDELDPFALILWGAEALSKDLGNEAALRIIGATVGRLSAKHSIIRAILKAEISRLVAIGQETEFGAGSISGRAALAVRIAKELGMYTITRGEEDGKAQD